MDTSCDSLYSNFQKKLLKIETKQTALINYKNSLYDYENFSFQELNTECNRVIECLNKHHLNKKNTTIGVKLQGLEITLIPVILGINAVTATFVCLDYEDNDLINNIMEQLKVQYIICLKSKISDKLAFDFRMVEEFEIFHNKILLVKLEQASTNFEVHDEHICYAICTSGSTSKPKFVQVTNNSIMSNIDYLRDYLSIDTDDVIWFHTPTTFDPFIVEVFLCLTVCCKLLITPIEIKQNHTVLKNIFNKHSIGVTFLQLPPSLFFAWDRSIINNIIFDKNSSLRRLILGGEPFPNPDVIREVTNFNRNIKIYNIYGVTEVSCWASIFNFEDISMLDQKLIMQYGVPLGEPMSDTEFLVVDGDKNPINIGDGVLYISCSRRKCFIIPSSKTDILWNQQLYRNSGDLVHIQDKNIFYIGRENNVIKRYGLKVSIEKIETTVLNYLRNYDCKVTYQCACTWYQSLNKLALFISGIKLNNLKLRELKKILIEKVSPAAVIDDIIFKDFISLTNHGKIDRNQIEKDFMQRSHSQQYCSFEHFCIRYLDIGNVDDINVKSFRNLGGTSILALQIINSYEQCFNATISNQILELLLTSDLPLLDICKRISDLSNENRNLKKPKILEEAKSHLFCKCADISYNGSIQLRILWRYNMKACVDATPLLCNNAFVVIGAHSKQFLKLSLLTGEKICNWCLPDRIEGSAVHKDSFVYIGCYDGTVSCFDINENSKSPHWTYKTNSKVKSKPAVLKDLDAIAVGSYDNCVHCLKCLNGELIWKTSVNGSISSDMLADDEYIFSATIRGYCYCLSANNGDIIWKQNVAGPIFGSGIFYNTNNTKIIIWSNAAGSVHSFNRNNGLLVWKFQTSEAIYSSLLIYDNKLYFGCYDHSIYVLELKEETYNFLIKCEFDAPIYSTMGTVTFNDVDYFLITTNKGIMYICDTNFIGITYFKLPGEVFSSPLCIKNQIIIGCRDDFVYCLELNM